MVANGPVFTLATLSASDTRRCSSINELVVWGGWAGACKKSGPHRCRDDPPQCLPANQGYAFTLQSLSVLQQLCNEFDMYPANVFVFFKCMFLLALLGLFPLMFLSESGRCRYQTQN